MHHEDNRWGDVHERLERGETLQEGDLELLTHKPRREWLNGALVLMGCVGLTLLVVFLAL